MQSRLITMKEMIVHCADLCTVTAGVLLDDRLNVVKTVLDQVLDVLKVVSLVIYPRQIGRVKNLVTLIVI